MSQRVLLETYEDGTKEYAHFDEQTGDLLHVERVEDVESVLDWCRGRFNAGLANRHCEFRHVGSYPQGVLEIFGRKYGIKRAHESETYANAVTRALGKDKELTKLLVNDRDLSGFRTLPGTY